MFAKGINAIVVLVLVSSLLGCAGHKIRSRLDTWTGMSGLDVQRHWGPPTALQELEDKTKSLSYRMGSCDVIFAIDSTGIVRTSIWRGGKGACLKLVQPKPE